jgi:hypothetical protein
MDRRRQESQKQLNEREYCEKDSAQRMTLPRADCEQNFLPEGVPKLFKLERRFTLVAQHFKDSRPILVRHFYTAIFEMHHMHLQRFDLEVPVIATIWAGQRHEQSPFNGFQTTTTNLEILCNGYGYTQ